MTRAIDTKDKIVSVASELFATRGYDGTSIREIAKTADVNLAAVNYHFTSKQSLYIEVFNLNYTKMKEDYEKINDEFPDLSTKELVLKIYNYLVNNGTSLLNAFKVILNSNILLDDNQNVLASASDFLPPGGEVILAAIKRDVGEDYPEEGLFWATTTIFSLLTHKGIMMNSTIVQKICTQNSYFNEENTVKYFNHFVDSILVHLKESKDQWNR